MSQQNNSTSSSPLNTQPSSSSFNKDEVEQQISKWKNKLKTFICPISQQLMTDPVMIPETGQTYDRKLIEQWLQRQNTCPTTGIKLKSKLLTPNYFAKSAINENIEKFIKKVIKSIKMWSTDINLIDVCLGLINESLDLIKNIDSHKNYQKELYELKFNILINEKNEDKLFNDYLKATSELQDLELKLIKLRLLENKLITDKYLQQYYYELLNLLIELKNNDNNDFLTDMFTKYCKLKNLNDNLINKILNYLKTDELKLDILSILLNESDYNRNNLLQKLLNIEIKNKINFITFFKKLFKEINLNETDLTILIEFIKNYKNDLQEELIIIYTKLYKKGNDIKYLEAIYDLNNENKDIETLLLNEYLTSNLMVKYYNLFIKVNENKLDSFNIMLLKLLQNQNYKIENQKNEIINLNKLSTNQNNKIINLQKLLTNQDKKFNEQNNKIIELQQTNKNLNNLTNNLQTENSNLKNELLNLNNWKNQQIINNFKTKYPEYDYINIVNIETPLNIKKGEQFKSDVFEVFGLKWCTSIFPKGSNRSNNDEITIGLYLNSLQYKNENEKEKKISSINIKFFIDNIYFNDNKNYEYNFITTRGWGGFDFKQSNFTSTTIKNDKQIFSIVIEMKQLDIQFKILNNIDNNILETKYKAELEHLFLMGFGYIDKQILLCLLEENNGSVDMVIEKLFTM